MSSLLAKSAEQHFQRHLQHKNKEQAAKNLLISQKASFFSSFTFAHYSLHVTVLCCLILSHSSKARKFPYILDLLQESLSGRKKLFLEWIWPRITLS